MLTNNKYKKMAKIQTQIISILAHGTCKIWAFGRSFSDKNNFDYFIRAVRPSPTKLPFIKKQVYEDDNERSVTLKIGEVVIEYSFSKTKEETDTNITPLFKSEYEPRDEVIKALVSITRQTHHNNSVLQFSNNRKERDGSKYREGNT
jgi:hypothetical protein